jgi:class 3 adenylate cyclase/predicted ATPase
LAVAGSQQQPAIERGLKIRYTVRLCWDGGDGAGLAMERIADWLQKLGLSQYAQTFPENEIDVSVLPHLTDQDLKDIGIPLGHRRKILATIAEHSGATSAIPKPALMLETRPEDRAERRQVTVMFSVLVGSTALSARMDPEDLREVISAYQKCVAETVKRFGGFVAKYMGDGVLIYFGYPQAHEDDAERAVRAGLELVTAVGRLQTHAPLQTRVGIGTGLVVVGDLIGAGSSQEQAIVGETPNLAARLQGLAGPNSVVIAESTRKLVGNLFELEDLKAKDLKGISGPARSWAVLRPASVESRFEALHTTGLTELIGREEELELVLRRWSKVKTGEGQVVLLSGESGIGKSRLTAALMDHVSSEPHTRLRYFCSPQHTDSALHPIISQMERVAGFAHDDSPQARLNKLDALLAQSFTPRRDAALIAEMLSLPNDGRYPALELPAQQRRQKTLEALTTQLEALSGSNPVLMVFEDAHWIDPTSLVVLGRAVDRVRPLRVLLIVTYRPEFEPQWIGQPHVSLIALNRLGEREIGAMIDGVTGNKPLPASVRQDIIERTDGIPLFVEEMTKAVLEAKTESETKATTSAVASSAVPVPASLHASLLARLDRLGPAKEVAQIGAAIGREFPQALLAAAAGKPDAELASALERLIAAGLLFRQGVPPLSTYLFKHALVQDAAYGTLLRDPRRALHTRIAQTLESHFTEIAENQPELVARHYTEAGLREQAAHFWGKAGQRSLERSALAEGVEQLTKALSQIATLPATLALRREEIRLHVALVAPLIHLKGHAAPDTRAAEERALLLIEQAETLGEAPEDPLLLFSVLYGVWVANQVAFNGDVCLDLAAQFLTLAGKQTGTVPLMIGHRLMGSSLLFTGDIAKGRAHLDQTVALYDPSKHRPLATQFGHDVRVVSLCYRSWAMWFLGYPDHALADADRALSDAREIGQAATLMPALCFASLTYAVTGRYADANARSDEVVALADLKGALIWKTFGVMNQGYVRSLVGGTSDAIRLITTGIAAWRSIGSMVFVPSFSSHLAKSYADIGQLDEAWRWIGEAMNAIETTKERWGETEANRIAGEIALMSPEPDAVKAQSYLEHALAIARQQQAKSWELRAAMSLARLWRDQGKVQPAHELLAPVYGWFTEGFDTRDLKEANALLEELAS